MENARRLLGIVCALAGCAETPMAPTVDSGVARDAGSTADLATAPSPALGATVDDGGVGFAVWAPHATRAWVVGDFPEAKVEMQPAAAGIFQVHLASAHAGTIYHYTFDSPSGTIDRTDPRCRELDPNGCKVIDPKAYSWQTPSFTRPARSASVVYELHVGSFAVPDGATQGTLATARARLAELADLGVDVVELMPVQSFGGKPNGWGYNPQLYFAPKTSYGTADNLRAFVDAAHGQGIAVWLDTVVNHCDGWSKAPLRCFDGACDGGTAGVYFFGSGTYATTPWGPRPDYTEPQVSSMLLASVDEWLLDFHGDGFRWDSVSNVRALDGQGTTPGGRALLVAANDRTHALGGFSVAEDLKGYAAITQATGQGGFGFDAQWDGFGYGVMGVLAQSSDDARDLGAIQGALTGSFAGDPFARLLFVEDHDTVGNGGARLPSRIDAADPTGKIARQRSMLGGVLLLTAPGVPMIFMGQESLAVGGFADPPAPLALPSGPGVKFRAFYQAMIRLRRNLDGGAGGLGDTGVEILHRNDSAKVIAYRRHGASGEDVIVAVNLRNKSYTEYDIGVPDAGPWRIRLDTQSSAFGDDFTDGPAGPITAVAETKDGRPWKLPLPLPAYGALVLTH